jgi:hypothetical protein
MIINIEDATNLFAIIHEAIANYTLTVVYVVLIWTFLKIIFFYLQ